MDNDPARCQEATETLQCRAYRDVASLLGDPEVELVVLATPSHLHATQSIDALARGKHVVCEKPMALSVRDADRMIAAAGSGLEQGRRLLTIFHNMRYWPDFLKVREVIASGRLGRIVQIKLTMHRFTRRWDWQTLREFGGGALFNAGAHLVDLALQLFGDAEPIVTADLQHVLASGDAEDHAKIVLRAASAPTIEVEISNVCAYPQDVWHVMGSAGGLRGLHEELRWKWIDLAALPDRPVDRNPAAADRKFNRESLSWHEESWTNSVEESAAYMSFYEDLYRALHGAPLTITPQSVRRTLSVLEAARRASE